MDKLLVEKYLKGNCSQPEAKKVLEWFQTQEGQQFLEQEIDRDARIFDEFGEYAAYPDLEPDQLFDRIQKSKSHTPKQENIETENSYPYWWQRAAAVTLVVGILSLFASFYLDFADTERKMVEANPGEKKTLLLPDSSKVVLHSNSSIEYIVGFESREVSLEGEAYFEVTHDRPNPFMVLVNDSYVKVLGTKFVVSEYSESERVEVAVQSGRVELGTRTSDVENLKIQQIESEDSKKIGKPIEVGNNEVGIMAESSIELVSDSIYSHQLFDWMEGKMIFRDTPLTQVISEIENRFDVQIILQSTSIEKKKFTSSFDEENLSEVLKVLSLSLDLEYKRDGKKIYLSE